MKSRIATSLFRPGSLLRTALFLLAATAGRSAHATGPELPVTVVRGGAGAAPLSFSVAANPRDVVEVSAVSTVESRGGTHLRGDVAPRTLIMPAANVSAQAMVAGPRTAVESLGPGVYAHNVEVTAKLRHPDANGKPLAIRSTEYFKVVNGRVSAISSEEYTAAVQPTHPVKLPGGQVVAEHDGAESDAPARPHAPGATPIGPDADAPPKTPPVLRTGRRK